MWKDKLADYFERAARWHVFFLLNIYGWGKILGVQFHRRDHLSPEIAAKTIGDVDGFNLAWAFFGYSYPYILFIGLAQIVGAWLLLWDKTKLIGAAILIPILLNIIAVDAAFGIPSGALVSACVYFVLLCYVLIYNRLRVFEAINTLIKTEETGAKTWQQKAVLTAIAWALVVIIYFCEHALMTLF